MSKKRAGSVPRPQRVKPKVEKKTFHLTQKMKIIGTVIASLALLAALFFIIRYNAEALSVDRDGRVITGDGNWLVYNVGRRDRPRYLKFGEIEPAQGYQLDRTDYTYNENESIFYFKPVIEDAAITSYSAMVGNGAYDVLSQSTFENLGSYSPDATFSELTDRVIDGKNIRMYAYSVRVKNAETGEIEEERNLLNAYAQAKGGHSILLTLEHAPALDGEAPGLDDYLPLLEDAVRGLLIE